MDLLLILLINGIANGSQYALLGLGFGLIFSSTRIVHFAYGTVFTFAAYVTWACIARLEWPTMLAVAAGIAASALLGGAIYLLLYRPFERSGAPVFVPLVASLGLVIIMENLIGIFAGTDTKVAIGFDNQTYLYEVAGSFLLFSDLQIMQVGALAVVSLLLWAFLGFTSYGQAIMAMNDDPQMARIIGINVVTVSVLVFVVGSAISAVPASIVLLKDGATTHMGFNAVFIGFVAVIVGGVGSLRGAALGGFLIGLVESIGMIKLSTEWQSTIAFVVLFLVLVFRPTGLFRGT